MNEGIVAPAMWGCAVLWLFLVVCSQPGDLHEPNSEKNDYEKCILEFDNCETNPKYSKQEPKSVICYFTNWSDGRPGKAKFTPANIDPALCTHINYAYGLLDNNTVDIIISENPSKESLKALEQLAQYRTKGVKILMSMGGSADSGTGDKWSRLIRNTQSHSGFACHTVEFLKKHHFDGLDLAYQFPGCPNNGNSDDRQPTDNDNFNKLLAALKTEFKKHDYLLSVTTSAAKKTIDKCYKMPGICEIADWVSMITYNYHDAYDNETGAVAPMCGTSTAWGVIESVKYYIETQKCSPQKLVLGVPFFGVTYTLKDKAVPKFGVPVTGDGKEGPFTKLEGFISFYEVCFHKGWHSGYNNVNGTFSWNGDQFISTPSIQDVKRKSCLVKHYDLKGAYFWTLDYDDFNNMCGYGNYPLLKSLNQMLRPGHC